MVKLVRDGVIMEVTDNVASVFKRAGYTEVVEKSATSFAPAETVQAVIHDQAAESEKKYSRTDINRMSAADLRALAPLYGIEVTEETSGASLKKALIEVLGI